MTWLRKTANQTFLPTLDKIRTVTARDTAEGETMEEVSNIISTIPIKKYVETLIIIQEQNGHVKVFQGLKSLSKEPGKPPTAH